MRVYLDNCCFNRPFDSQAQARVRLETEAKLRIQERVVAGEIELAWSSAEEAFEVHSDRSGRSVRFREEN